MLSDKRSFLLIECNQEITLLAHPDIICAVSLLDYVLCVQKLKHHEAIIYLDNDRDAIEQFNRLYASVIDLSKSPSDESINDLLTLWLSLERHGVMAINISSGAIS